MSTDDSHDLDAAHEQELSDLLAWRQALRSQNEQIAAEMGDALPELREQIQGDRQRWKLWLTALFLDVFQPYLHRLLDAGDDVDGLTRAFAFLERVAAYPDQEIPNVTMGVLYDLWPSETRMERAQAYMGPATLSCLAQTRAWYAPDSDVQQRVRHERRQPFPMPRGPDARVGAYPTVEQLLRGVILSTIAKAVADAAYDAPEFDEGWSDGVYWQYNGGYRAALRFDGDSVVGCFFGRDSDRNPFSRRGAYDPRPCVAGMPAELLRLAERSIFGFMLVHDWRDRTAPVITAAVWSTAGRLLAAEPWRDVLRNGAHLVENHLRSIDAALPELIRYHELSPAQVTLVRALFERRTLNPSGVTVTPEERDLIIAEGRAAWARFHHEQEVISRDDGYEWRAEDHAPPNTKATRRLLAQIDIDWPDGDEPLEVEELVPDVPPPWLLEVVPSLEQVAILQQLDALAERAASIRHVSEASHLMDLFVDDQVDVDVLVERYTGVQSEAITRGLASLAYQGFRLKDW